MFMFVIVAAIGVHPDLIAAIELVDADRVTIAAAQAKLAIDAAALEAVFHVLYPVPQPLPGPQPVVDPKIKIIMIGGEGCAPCIKMRPILAALQAEGVAVTEVGAESAAGQKWSVTATPTFITVYDGQELTRAVGVLTQKQLAVWWDETVVWCGKKYPKK